MNCSAITKTILPCRLKTTNMWVSLWVVVCVSVMCALHVARKPPPSGVWWGSPTHTPTTLSDFGHYPCAMFMLGLLISHYINLFSLNLSSLNLFSVNLFSLYISHINVFSHSYSCSYSYSHCFDMLSFSFSCSCALA